MTSLDFLSPDRARSDLGFTPELTSSMDRRQRDARRDVRGARRLARPVSIPGRAGAPRHGRHRRSLAPRQDRGLGEGARTRSSAIPSGTDHRRQGDRPLPVRSGCFRSLRALAEAGAMGARRDGRATACWRSSGPEAPTVMRRLTPPPPRTRRAAMSRTSPRTSSSGSGGFWIVFPQEYGHYLWEVAVDAAEPFGGGPVGVDAHPGRHDREGHLLPEAHLADATSLKKRYDVVDHRRRRARPGHGLLPLEEPRRQERRRAREELHRCGRLGPQHDDHPLELPHRRGRRVLPREREALRVPLAGAELQHDVLPARPPHAGAFRPRHDRLDRARRGEPAARHRQPRGRPRRGQGALPADPSRTAPGRSTAPSITRPAGSSATTRSSGATRGRPTGTAPRSTRASR